MAYGKVNLGGKRIKTGSITIGLGETKTITVGFKPMFVFSTNGASYVTQYNDNGTMKGGGNSMPTAWTFKTPTLNTIDIQEGNNGATTVDYEIRG